MTLADEGWEVARASIDRRTCAATCEHIEEQIVRAVASANDTDRFWPRFASSARRATWLFEDGSPPRPETAVRYGHGLHLADPALAELVMGSEIGGALERAIGDGYSILQSAVVRKPPGLLDAQFGWHQDAWYLPANPDEVVLAFVPLDDTTRENGCLEVLPRSHRAPRTQTLVLGPDGFRPASGRDPGPFDATGAVTLALPRGAIALIHGRTFHASGPNRTSAPRRCLIVHAMPAGGRLDPRSWLATVDPA